MDPIIKRVLVDPPVKLAPKGIRLASSLAFCGFLGAVFYAKNIAPGQMEADIARDMYSKSH
jgi:hypothetical protein